ncbi:alpha/beta hydrolase [Nitrosophilus alvini]|uniref:alpha/beta hydrolase n=1 Tax=Nitrosophilus alvini TaxID=2714855 RepID=UPI00190CDA4F|nr:alpha/beta fold hydrolase [Nitrosophilus alvini]
MIIQTILFLVLLYLLLVLRLYLTQDRKIFHPELAPKEIKLPKNAKKIYYKTSDGITLEGAFLKNRETNPLVLYFGGNANNALMFLDIAQNIKDFNFLVFNYRGYANSTGKPSQKAIFKDALEIYDNFAKNKEVYIVGRSLGSSVAAYLASRRKSKGVLLITPFDSILAMAKEKYPYLPVSLILKHPFETCKYVQNIDEPIAVIEAHNDEVIPDIHIENLKKNIKNLVFDKVIHDTTHNNILINPDFLIILKDALKTLRSET